MRALAICGSPRVGGNTEFLLGKVIGKLDAAGIETHLVRLAERSVRPCIACATCAKTKDQTCAIKDDDFHAVFSMMLGADIVVLGSPVYFGSATPQMMALLDRAGYVSRMNGNLLSRKIGGAVVVARRAGQNFTFAQLLFWFLINDMIVPGSSYWNVAIGAAKGQVETDAEGVQTAERFGENLAWLAKKIQA